MTFEEIRQALFELNRLHDTLRSAERFRKGIREGETPSPRISTHLIEGVNPEHLTWDDLRHAAADLEERIVRETGFGVEYCTLFGAAYSTTGDEMGSYALIPKNEGWLKLKRAGAIPEGNPPSGETDADH
jgi:hypothetical protein